MADVLMTIQLEREIIEMTQKDHLERQPHIQRWTTAFLLFILGAHLFQRKPKAFPADDLIDLEQGGVQFVEFGQQTVLVENAGLHVHSFRLNRMPNILPSHGVF